MSHDGSLDMREENIEADGDKNVVLENPNEDIGESKFSQVQKSDMNDKNEEVRQDQEHQEIPPQQDKPQYQHQHQHYENLMNREANQQIRELQVLQQEQAEDNEQKSMKMSLIQQTNKDTKKEDSPIVSPIVSKHNENNPINEQNDQLMKQIKVLLFQLQNQLRDMMRKNKNENGQKDDKIRILSQQIQILQIRFKLNQNMKKRKNVITIDRLNHLDHIFKHYCTQIFKTGKHMTFDRLEYEKNHLAIDRFFFFLKDFNLTFMKTKDGKMKEIVDKQEVIKLFKKISPNCRDLNFEQFIIIIEKLAEIYFDSMVNYEERKKYQRIQRLKIKQNLQKREKQKQQMLKKHKEKIQSLEKIELTLVDTIEQRVQTQGGQNDDLVQQLMNKQTIEGLENDNTNEKVIQKSKVSQKSSLKDLKIQKSPRLTPRPFKKQTITNQIKSEQNPLLRLSKEEKHEYFYEIINVDNPESFMNKLRELNFPLFKIYASQNGKIKEQKKKDERTDVVFTSNTEQQEEEKRIKELRKLLNERTQKLRHLSTPVLSKQQYEFRKLERSRMQQQKAKFGFETKDKKKSGKIDLSNTEINLQSLNKLSYQNVNFTKFDPRSLFSKEEDDKIFLKEYDVDSPVKVRRIVKNFTELTKITPHSKTVIQEKTKIPINFLEKLKQRQVQVQNKEKKQQVSQLYRLNDRTQRQKKLIDKFLDKNR